MQKRSNFLLFVLFVFQLGYLPSLGNFDLLGLVLLFSVSFFLLFAFFLNRGFSSAIFDDENLAWFLFLLQVAYGFVYYEKTLTVLASVFYPDNFTAIVWSSRMTFVLSLILAIFVAFWKKVKFFFLLSVCGLLLQFFVLLMAPEPYIDIFDILKSGSFGALNLNNPYQMMFKKYYNFGPDPDFYTYFPGSFLIVMPITAFFGDPRLIYLAASAVSVFCLYKIASKYNNKGKLILPGFYLFLPISYYVIERSYLEPLLVGLIILSVYLLTVQKMEKLSAVVLGVTLSIKQSVMLLPLFLWKSYKLKNLIGMFIVFSLIVLPFFFLSPADFIHDTLLVLKDYPSRSDALTLNSLISYFFKKNLPSYVFIFVWIFSLLFFLKSKVMSSTLGNSIFGFALWYLVFTLFNKIAFAEFYYFVTSLILLSISLGGFGKAGLKSEK